MDHLTERAEHMTSENVIIWREAMQKALDCVPFEIRNEVLRQLSDKQKAGAKSRFKVISLGELQPTDSDGLWNPIARASSVVVQRLVRFIRNNHSPQRAAGIMFREHRDELFRGTGSGFLPDYLDGLPGITVDRDKCIGNALAEIGGKAA
jgi:hypothetical protein